MATVTPQSLAALKQAGKRFVCLTAYDSTFAKVVDEAGIETILVGDSLGMVLQGHDSTVPVTISDMAYHVGCVARACKQALVIGDLPFMSYATTEQTLTSATALMAAGAHMVKLEGGTWLCPTVEA
jgi:3-methyl-2-oxobutanoate hydroxymethyltransferase